jgi:hypothetical protein
MAAGMRFGWFWAVGENLHVQKHQTTLPVSASRQ